MVLRAKAIEFVVVGKSGEPSFVRDRPRQFQREAGLAAPAGADQHANGDRRFMLQPKPQVGHLAIPADERHDVGAIGAEQGRF